jgi:hypothetical protein
MLKRPSAAEGHHGHGYGITTWAPEVGTVNAWCVSFTRVMYHVSQLTIGSAVGISTGDPCPDPTKAVM